MAFKPLNRSRDNTLSNRCCRVSMGVFTDWFGIKCKSGTPLDRIPPSLRNLFDWLVPGAAASVATTTATAAAAVTTTAARRTLFARASLIHGQGAAFPILAIQRLDGGLGAFLGVHGNESEAPGPAGFSIHHDIDLIYRTVLRKHVPEVVFGHVKREVLNI